MAPGAVAPAAVTAPRPRQRSALAGGHGATPSRSAPVSEDRAARGVHEQVQVGNVLQRGGLGELGRVVDDGRDLDLHRRDVRVGEDPLGRHPIAQGLDRVVGPPRLDLGLLAVALRVEHRVGAEPERARLEEVRATPGAHGVHRPPRGVGHGADVHPVHRPRGHLVGRGLHREVRLGLRARQCGAHRVQVVLADEQHGQPPDRGEVDRLVELPLGHRPLAEEAGGDPVAAGQLVGQRDPDGQRQPAPDDRVAPVEPGRCVEQVHRPAAPAAASGDPAEHLGHHRPRGHPLEQGVSVLAVGRDDRVVGLQRRHHPGGHRLLADVHVQEAADRPGAVQLHAALLEAAHEQHVAQQSHVAGRIGGHRGAPSGSAGTSRVLRSPSARPSSRARSRRRMILPGPGLGQVVVERDLPWRDRRDPAADGHGR